MAPSVTSARPGTSPWGPSPRSMPTPRSARTVLQPLQDRINVLKRDALCDYIMGRQAELGFRTHADIYDFFLLDVRHG